MQQGEHNECNDQFSKRCGQFVTFDNVPYRDPDGHLEHPKNLKNQLKCVQLNIEIINLHHSSSHSVFVVLHLLRCDEKS